MAESDLSLLFKLRGDSSGKTVDDEIQGLLAESSDLKKAPKVTFSEDGFQAFAQAVAQLRQSFGPRL